MLKYHILNIFPSFSLSFPLSFLPSLFFPSLAGAEAGPERARAAVSILSWCPLKLLQVPARLTFPWLPCPHPAAHRKTTWARSLGMRSTPNGRVKSFMFVVSHQWSRKVGATRETFPPGEPSLARAKAATFCAQRASTRVLGRQPALSQ